MTETLPQELLQRFRHVVTDRVGLSFDDAKQSFLSEVLTLSAEERRLDVATYVEILQYESEQSPTWSSLSAALTVPETYFFRNIDQFRAFSEVALPERLASRRPVRILSAGCASGEEAYSLAILAHELCDARQLGDIEILAIDLNAVVLHKAVGAEYSSWALRETPEHLRARWFERGDGKFRLSARPRSFVRFEQRNLFADDGAFWSPDRFDVVFCRNVLMYFAPARAARLVAKLARALAPGGYLFLGHAESLRELSRDFQLCHTHGTFYYRLRETNSRHAPAGTPTVATGHDSTPAAFDVADWPERIRRSSDRVRSLTSASECLDSDKPGGWSAAKALDLLQAERYAEALDVFSDDTADWSQDGEASLLRAVLLAQIGRLDEAAAACDALLQLDSLNAGAYYVRALCHEGRGARDAAMADDRAAVQLDPDFAMPHLHLGMLARKSGDRDLARQELRMAMLLLQHEPPTRLLLFGSGFGRLALVEICRNELSAFGGSVS